ncbi:hypothetical protein DFAR_3240015 [Desulfarculales bacterium]
MRLDPAWTFLGPRSPQGRTACPGSRKDPGNAPLGSQPWPEVTEDHGPELGPTRKSLDPGLGTVLLGQGSELSAEKVMQQLTEQAGYSCHSFALFWSQDCWLLAEPHHYAGMRHLVSIA